MGSDGGGEHRRGRGSRVKRARDFLLAAPPREHAETLAEKRQRWFDNGMAILMAVAAILATWASFEASRYGGKASSLVSQSSIARSDSGRYASRGVEQTIVDASVWLEWEKAIYLDRDEFAAFVRDRFSPSLDVAQDLWIRNTPMGPDGTPVNNLLPKGTPMGMAEYVPEFQAKAEQLAAESEAQLAESERYGAISGRYIMLTVFLALVLFFGSVATKFTSPRIQLGLGSLAVTLLLFAVVKLILLPVL